MIDSYFTIPNKNVLYYFKYTRIISKPVILGYISTSSVKGTILEKNMKKYIKIPDLICCMEKNIRIVNENVRPNDVNVVVGIYHVLSITK
jgi:hypothetical protein